MAGVAQGAVRTGNGDDGFAALRSGQGAVFSNGHCRAIAGERYTGLALCSGLFLIAGVLVFVGIVHSQVNGLADFDGHGFRHIDAGNGGAAAGQQHNCGHGSGHDKDSFHGSFLLLFSDFSISWVFCLIKIFVEFFCCSRRYDRWSYLLCNKKLG